MVNTGKVDPELRNVLVSGHLRVKVLVASGYTHADAVLVDYTADLHRARMISANRQNGEDEMGRLKDLLETLDRGQKTDTGALLADLTGFDEAERERLMTQVWQDPDGAGDAQNAGESKITITVADVHVNAVKREIADVCAKYKARMA